MRKMLYIPELLGMPTRDLIVSLLPALQTPGPPFHLVTAS